MASITNITIGIQARSTSVRFPGKVFEKIGDRTMLEHVIDACYKSSIYLNHHADRRRYFVNVGLCVPFNDEITKKYSGDVPVIEGPENDVLSRYVLLANRFRTDYIVRITADCPMMVSAIITKHVNTALMNGYDYVSNVDEICRTFADGYDCEVMTMKLLKYLDEHAKDPKDREHVTTYVRREWPSWVHKGIVMGHEDRSDEKLSVDNDEDLEKVRSEHGRLQDKLKSAEQIYGSKNIHRF